MIRAAQFTPDDLDEALVHFQESGFRIVGIMPFDDYLIILYKEKPIGWLQGQIQSLLYAAPYIAKGSSK